MNVQFKEVASFINGYPFKPSDWSDTGLPIIRIQDLTGTTDKPNHYEGQYPKKIEVNDGDILISWSASLGVYRWNKGKALLNQHIFKVDFNKKPIDSGYFVWAVEYKLTEMKYKTHGSTMKHIVKGDFDAITIPYPRISDQANIASQLDNIKRLISAKEEELSNLDSLVKSRFMEMFGEPKTNPQEFPVIPLSNVFDIGSSKRVYESEWTSCGVPFYRAREIVSLSKNGFVDNALFITEEMYRQYKNKYGVPKENDMMVTGVGTLGVCYIVKQNDKFYFKDGNTLWFKNKGLCNVIFIKELFDTDFVKEQIVANANASTVGTYTITKANNTMIIYPPIELQNEFAEFVKLIDKSRFVD